MPKLTFISDTHGMHENLIIESTDILIHTGDFCKYGNIVDVVKFTKWLKNQPVKEIVIVSGNHDLIFEGSDRNLARNEFRDFHYLEDSYVKLMGYWIYGSPYTPSFGSNWAFNIERKSEEMKHKWNLIPSNTEILLTHGPSYGILDSDRNLESAGCEFLKERINNLADLKIHAFGHLHCCGGQITRKNNTTFVNAAMATESYVVGVRKPVVINLEDKE